jgi:hypothetical protein
MKLKYPLQDAAGDDKGAGGGAAAADAGAAAGKDAAGVDAGAKSEDSWWKPEWRDQVSKGDKTVANILGRYATPADAIQSAIEMRKKISSGEIRMPLPKDAKPEDVAKWRADNGIPESPDKYQLTLRDGLSIGKEDKPIIDGFLKAMHEKNTSPDVASAAVDWYYSEVERRTEERATQDKALASEAQEALRQEWGAEYRTNLNVVENLLSTMPKEMVDEFKFGRLANGTPIMASPAAIKWMLNMNLQLNPHSKVVPNSAGNAASAIDDEIGQIEKTMKTDRKTYDKDEKMQARLRELYGAREGLKARA